MLNIRRAVKVVMETALEDLQKEYHIVTLIIDGHGEMSLKRGCREITTINS